MFTTEQGFHAAAASSCDSLCPCVTHNHDAIRERLRGAAGLLQPSHGYRSAEPEKTGLLAHHALLLLLCILKEFAMTLCCAQSPPCSRSKSGCAAQPAFCSQAMATAPLNPRRRVEFAGMARPSLLLHPRAIRYSRV